MEYRYTLEWYDSLISVTLNPERADVAAITKQQTEAILITASGQRDKWLREVKREIYGMNNKAQIEFLVRRCHSDLILLADQAYDNHNRMLQVPDHLRKLSTAIVSDLHELLSFLEDRYLKYLGMEQLVPVVCMQKTKDEMKARLGRLKVRLARRISDKTLIEIVLGTLQQFFSKQDSRRVSFAQAGYMKELILGLEQAADLRTEAKVYQAVNEFLIYMNFNKKAYLNYYTEMVAARINCFGSFSDKIDQLFLAYKEFNQMHIRPDVKLKPKYKGVKHVIGNWFAQEIAYLEKKYQWEVSLLEVRSGHVNPSGPLPKVRLSLNADQIAILIRAFSSQGVLEKGTMHAVFKHLVPYLSSKERVDLSWDSMRKRSYTPEDKDKKAVLAILENAMTAIRKFDGL